MDNPSIYAKMAINIKAVGIEAAQRTWSGEVANRVETSKVL